MDYPSPFRSSVTLVSQWVINTRKARQCLRHKESKTVSLRQKQSVSQTAVVSGGEEVLRLVFGGVLAGAVCSLLCQSNGVFVSPAGAN